MCNRQTHKPNKKHHCSYFNIYTYSFFFDGFLFGLSPSESLLPWFGRTQRFRTQQKHLLTITTRSTWTELKDPLGGTMSRVVRQTAQTDLSSGRLSYPFTSAPIFKRAGSCLLRFDLLTPYTSGCSSHICTQRPTPPLENYYFYWYLPFLLAIISHWFHGLQVLLVKLFCWENKQTNKNHEPGRVAINLSEHFNNKKMDLNQRPRF